MNFQNDINLAKECFSSLLICPENGDPIVCNIHDIFHDENSSDHNCIGCNLANSILLIDSFFKRSDSYDDIQDIYTDLILKLYLFVERAYELFKIIELQQDYRLKNFTNFHLIHKWANFIKHPKAFMFSHDPSYFVGEAEDGFDVIVDNDFVKRFYSGGNRNLELYRKVENNVGVAVVFPQAEILTKLFAKDVLKIAPLISNNAVYRTILNERSTFEAYFEDEDEN